MKRDSYTDPSGTVCLDATEVKRIRERQQLTQLYVSKVVGVTTDTISRWENNRYPSIRRENALKLADALEVSLDEILQKPASESSEVDSSREKKTGRLWGLLVIVLFLVLIGAYLIYSKAPPPPPAVTVQRFLPEYAAPGSSIPVQLVLTDRADNGGVILREYFPKGWKIIQSHPPASSLDNVNGIARWILKAGDVRDRVVYLVQVDPDAESGGTGVFQGEVVASREGRQSAVKTKGRSNISVGPIHWADADGDGRIDDGEMLQGSYTIEDMAGVHIDWNDLEKLWDAGSYAWSREKGRFVPLPR